MPHHGYGGATLYQEAQRRNKIIKDLAARCDYKAGDIVKPSLPKGVSEYGENIEVEYIMDSYVRWPKDEKWPKNDTPFIVCAWSKLKKERFFCTPGYLIAKAAA